MTTTWTIAQCDRDVATGGITVAHWRVTATDGDYSASAYGTCGFQPDPDAPGFVPYANVTEAEVLGWCWANGIDKDATEASLASQIEAQKHPTTESGLPWA